MSPTEYYSLHSKVFKTRTNFKSPVPTYNHHFHSTVLIYIFARYFLPPLM